jgi:hypothetical protein
VGSRSYERLDIYTFGERLVFSKDLDPVYVILWEGTPELEGVDLCRWLLAYWAFYHVGTASYITQCALNGGKGSPDSRYWDAMLRAAGSKDWPRGSERRHYRGQQAERSVEWLADQGVEYLFRTITHFPDGYSPELADVMNLVQCWRGFGQWIAFKVADMLERLDLVPVVFTEEDLGKFSDGPRQGAELLWKVEGEPHSGAGDRVLPWAVGRLRKKLGHIPAPPRYERGLDVQEYETILCKWSSHMKGHYPLGNDIHEIKKGLLRFCKCRVSQGLYVGGREGGLW